MTATDDAAAKYGAIGAMVQEVPELKGIFDQAVAEGWTSDKFVMTVQNTEWWKNNSESTRQVVSLQTTDPATYANQLQARTDAVIRNAAKLGYDIDPLVAQDVAYRAWLSNWSDEKVQAETVGRGAAQGTAGGQYATTADQLRQTAAAYGGQYPESVIDGWTKNILNGSMTAEQWTSQMKSNAVSTFPALADQINNMGMTVMQIAAPYINTYAQLMEVPPESVDFKTNLLVRKALQGTGNSADANGTTPVVTPLWKLEQQVKQEPGWGLTRNAHAEVDSITNRLGKDFGFLS